MSRLSSFAVVVAVGLVPALAWGQAPIPIAPPVGAPAQAGVAAPAPYVVPAPVIVPAQPQVAMPVNPADGECVTTTTVTTRCTGAAAPYASRPAPPAVIVAPPPQAYPTIEPVPVVLPPGFHLQQDPDGTWWRVRQHHGRAAIWAPGLVLWMSSYVAGIFGGAMQGDPTPTFPIIGAWIASARNNDAGSQAGWAADGILQLGGFIMFVAGASMDGKLEKLPITVTPIAFHGGGSGVGLSGRF